MYSASCLCGAVRIELAGGITDIIHCHCSRCRKSSGTAYATNGFVAASDLEVMSGAERIRAYEVMPGKRRHFCETCASPLYSSNDNDPDRLRLRLGILDSEIVERPMSHNFVSSRAGWDSFEAVLPHYDGSEPGRT